MHRFVIAVLVGIATATVVVVTAAPLLAHVSIDPQEAPADSFARFAFRVGHGCDGSPTSELAIQIPEGVVSVRPEVVPGWEYETVVGEFTEPVTLHGEEITEGVREVRWFGGPPIPDDAFAEFGLSVRLPDAPGETLHFPVVQSCEEGEHAWIELPADGQSSQDLEEPAPALLLTVPANEDTEQDAGGTEAPAEHAERVAAQARVIAIAALVVGMVAGATTLVRGRQR